MQCVYSSLPDWVVTSVNMIYELLQVRWNRMCLQLLNSYKLDCIVEAVCTFRPTHFVNLFLLLFSFACVYVDFNNNKKKNKKVCISWRLHVKLVPGRLTFLHV